jgi:hypothetical protein
VSQELDVGEGSIVIKHFQPVHELFSGLAICSESRVYLTDE